MGLSGMSGICGFEVGPVAWAGAATTASRLRIIFVGFYPGSFRRCAFSENNRWAVAWNIFDVRRRGSKHDPNNVVLSGAQDVTLIFWQRTGREGFVWCGELY
jgi:hypothetical protein